MLTKRNTVVYSWFLLFVFYSIVVRIRPFTFDIVHYANAFSSWPPPLTVYTLREPVAWLGGRLIHQLLGHDVATLVAIDILIASVLLVGLRPTGGDGDLLFSLAPTIAISYVYLLGQQNILRQHIAFVLLLCAAVPGYRVRPRSVILFTLAFLSHNASAFLAGYLFDIHSGRNRQIGPLITGLGVLLLVFLLPFLGKSAAATGLDTRVHYVAVLLSLTLLLLYANSARVVFDRAPSLLNFFAFLPAMAVLSSASFERIAMMFLVFLTIDVYLNHRSLGLRRLVAGNIAYGALVIPVFVFPSTQQFLLM